MTRLIDKDMLIEILGVMQGLCDTKAALIQNSKIWQQVKDLPTVDAVPVVRCKDCKHYYEKEWVVGGGSYTTCWYQTIANAQPNDFCSRAERKDE